jgi:hypothetical protein
VLLRRVMGRLLLGDDGFVGDVVGR